MRRALQGLATDVRVSIGSRSSSDVQTVDGTLKEPAWRSVRRLFFAKISTEVHRTACASGSRPRGGTEGGKSDQKGRAWKTETRNCGLELCGARRLSQHLGEPLRGRCCWARIFCPPAEEKMWVASPAPPHPRCRFSRSSIDNGDDAASPSGLFWLLRIRLVRDSSSSIFGL